MKQELGIAAAILIWVGGVAFILHEVEKPEPKAADTYAARVIAPPLDVKNKGYIIKIGPTIARSPEPNEAQAAVYILTKGKPAWMSCALIDPNGSPLGGGVVAALNRASGATMGISGPLLSKGKLDCQIVEDK